MKQKVLEKDAQRAILGYLKMKGVFHYRNNTGVMFTNKGKDMYRFGAVGSPDIICVIDGKYVGIEVKGSSGKQSEGQIKFQKELEAVGGRYILAYSIDDVQNAGI